MHARSTKLDTIKTREKTIATFPTFISYPKNHDRIPLKRSAEVVFILMTNLEMRALDISFK